MLLKTQLSPLVCVNRSRPDLALGVLLGVFGVSSVLVLGVLEPEP